VNSSKRQATKSLVLRILEWTNDNIT